MSFPVSTGINVVKDLQFTIQTTRDTIPASPTFTMVGNTQEITPNSDMNSVTRRRLGSPDFYRVSKTGERFNFDFAYTPVDKVLLSKAINLAADDATHNRDNILAFAVSQMMNVSGTLTEKYLVPIGAQCDSTSIDISIEDCAVGMTWIPLDIPLPNATPPGITGTPTWATPISAEPWHGISGLLNPFSWNAVNKQIMGFSCTVNNNINQIQVLGNANLFAGLPTLRDISFTLDMLYEDDVMAGDVESMTPRAMEMKLSSDTKLVFTNAYLTNYTETFSATSTDVKMHTYNGVSQKVVVTTI